MFISKSMCRSMQKINLTLNKNGINFKMIIYGKSKNSECFAREKIIRLKLVMKKNLEPQKR